MRRIILSSNDNWDYMYFVPLTARIWKIFGWEPLYIYTRAEPRLEATMNIEELILTYSSSLETRILRTSDFKKYRSDTISQVSRLYGALYCNSGDMIMTGDADMLPLSDYWQPKEDSITVYGHDLTGYGHHPICYISMVKERWVEVMGLSSDDVAKLINRDLDEMPQALSSDFYKYWVCDQDLITQRIKATQFPVTSVLRGQYKNGYAVGRVDRGTWTLDHPKFIDAHLHHQIYHRGNEWKFNLTVELLHKIWPNEDFTWFEEYTKEFKKLTGHD